MITGQNVILKTFGSTTVPSLASIQLNNVEISDCGFGVKCIVSYIPDEAVY